MAPGFLLVPTILVVLLQGTTFCRRMYFWAIGAIFFNLTHDHGENYIQHLAEPSSAMGQGLDPSQQPATASQVFNPRRARNVEGSPMSVENEEARKIFEEDLKNTHSGNRMYRSRPCLMIACVSMTLHVFSLLLNSSV